jgi:chromosomal replication initiator protein
VTPFVFRGTAVSNAQVWRAAQQRLRPQMTGAQFETWLGGTSLARATNGAAVLSVRTTFAREMLETRFRERIEVAIREVTGKHCSLRIVVAPEGPADDEPEPAPASHRPPQRPQPAEARTQLAGVAVARNTTRRGTPSVMPQSLFDPEEASAPAERTVTTSRSLPLANPLAVVTSSADPDGPSRRSTPARPAFLGAGGGGQAESARGPQASRPKSASTPQGTRPTSDPDSRERPTADRRADRNGGRNQLDGAPEMNERSANSNERSSNSDWNSAAQSANAQPRLNPRYTFSTFIVGANSRLAYAASQAVAEASGRSYNPLFLYGGVGLGKTHLLHAIGHSGLEQGLVVLYVSSETFTNDIVNAIRYRTTDEFRAKYRSVDVLLVDDIQFIAGKDSTEEEFFHTFNALHEMNKQIVICSDRPPKAIVSLEERLRSRFEWGLIADIQPPELETRVAILRAKCDMIGREVPDEVIQFLASRVQSNIRELEGSLNRLLAFTQLQHMPLTLETAKSALANLATDSRARRVSITEILDAVAEYYRIPLEELCGKRRDKHTVGPRHIAMYLMRQETDASLLEIGQALGGRDHSTVLHGCENISREVNDNTTMRKEVLAIRQQLLG